MKRRNMLLAAGVIVLVASASLYYLTLPPPSPMKLRLGTFGATMPTLTNSGQRLAIDLGYYEAEGIEVEVLGMENTPVILQALAAGEIDIASVAAINTIKLAATGDLPHKAFVGDSGHGAPGAMLVVARKEIATIQDLKGASIGISRPGDPVQRMTIPVLRELGIDPDKDVQWVGVGRPAARVAGLKTGTLDAIITSIMTWATLVGDPDLHVLIDTETMSKFQPPTVSGFIAPIKLIEENPEVLLRFVRAHTKIHRYFAENKDAWIDAVRAPNRRPDMTPEQLSTIYDNLVWAVNGGLNLDDAREMIDYYYGLPDYEGVPRISASEWITTQFVDQVLKEEGVYPGIDDPGRAISGLEDKPVIVAKEADR